MPIARACMLEHAVHTLADGLETKRSIGCASASASVGGSAQSASCSHEGSSHRLRAGRAAASAAASPAPSAACSPTKRYANAFDGSIAPWSVAAGSQRSGGPSRTLAAGTPIRGRSCGGRRRSVVSRPADETTVRARIGRPRTTAPTHAPPGASKSNDSTGARTSTRLHGPMRMPCA